MVSCPVAKEATKRPLKLVKPSVLREISPSKNKDWSSVCHSQVSRTKLCSPSVWLHYHYTADTSKEPGFHIKNMKDKTAESWEVKKENTASPAV